MLPQTVGDFTITSYIDVMANKLVATSELREPFLFGGALKLRVSGDFNVRG
jgi:hypothetical protein